MFVFLIMRAQICLVVCCAQCGKVGAWERAKGIVADMRADGITPTVFTYSSLINAYSKVGVPVLVQYREHVSHT